MDRAILWCRDCDSVFFAEWSALEHEAVFNHVITYSNELGLDITDSY